MAIVHAIGEPDTETERAAIRHLTQQLPDDYTILHNLEIPNRAGFPYEIDLIVIAPHAAYVLEEKGYTGHVTGNAHQWRLASGVVVPNPIPRLNKKVRVIGGRVKAADRTLQDVFFDALILLSDPRTTIQLRDAQASRVVRLYDVASVLMDADRLPVRAAPVGGRRDRVLAALTAGAAPRIRRRQMGVYRIVELINETTEYTEYLAEHQYLRIDPRARLKVYHFDVYQGPDGRARQIELIMRDINALRTLADHPNIARAVDVFPWEPNCFVMVTEWIDGDTLRALIDTAEGPLEPEMVLGLARQIGRGLAYAHNRGVIHRDLRPENVIITSAGRAKLTNFDCARVSLGAGDTIAGQVSAYWDERYVAPEALLAPERASPQSDLYALGIVLYESLAGERPYASVSEMLRASTFSHRVSEAAHGVPPAWDAIIARLCHFDRSRRYPRAEVFLTDLDASFGAGG